MIHFPYSGGDVSIGRKQLHNSTCLPFSRTDSKHHYLHCTWQNSTYWSSIVSFDLTTHPLSSNKIGDFPIVNKAHPDLYWNKEKIWDYSSVMKHFPSIHRALDTLNTEQTHWKSFYKVISIPPVVLKVQVLTIVYKVLLYSSWSDSYSPLYVHVLLSLCPQNLSDQL